jgi:flagellar protein FliS
MRAEQGRMIRQKRSPATRRTVNAMWKESYLESRVLAASPLDLVYMLYEHAVRCVQDARRHLAANDIPARTTAICKSIAIISELRGSLDHKAGGAIAANLESLYEYMQKRLTDSNMKQQDQPLAEVESLLMEVAEAWSNIRQAGQEEAPPIEEAPCAVDGGSWRASFGSQPEFEPSASCWSA